jgi:hypothetical protein
MPGVKNIAYQPAIFAEVQAIALAGNDPRGILTSVLKHRQGLVQLLVDLPSRYDSGYATH